MRVRPPPDLVLALACPACERDKLEYGSDRVWCVGCGRTFACHENVIDFVDVDHLSETARRERAENSVPDPAQPAYVESVTHKGEDHPPYLESMRRAFRIVARMLAASEEPTLVSLGSNAGFELKHLLPLSGHRDVLSSDISWTATSVVPVTLREFPGDLGLPPRISTIAQSSGRWDRSVSCSRHSTTPTTRIVRSKRCLSETSTGWSSSSRSRIGSWSCSLGWGSRSGSSTAASGPTGSALPAYGRWQDDLGTRSR
jgi:hypothetical protein